MTSSSLDIFVKKDRNYEQTLQVFDENTSSAINLTNYVIKLEVRTAPGSTVLLTMSTVNAKIAISNATQGTFILSLTAAETKALAFTKAVYDLIFIAPVTGVVTEILTGNFIVLPTITSST